MEITFKKLRLRKELTINEVASRLGVTESSYRKYERCARIPRADKIGKIQAILECTDEEILKALKYITQRKTKE